MPQRQLLRLSFIGDRDIAHGGYNVADDEFGWGWPYPLSGTASVSMVFGGNSSRDGGRSASGLKLNP